MGLSHLGIILRGLLSQEHLPYMHGYERERAHAYSVPDLRIEALYAHGCGGKIGGGVLKI